MFVYPHLAPAIPRAVDDCSYKLRSETFPHTSLRSRSNFHSRILSFPIVSEFGAYSNTSINSNSNSNSRSGMIGSQCTVGVCRHRCGESVFSSTREGSEGVVVDVGGSSDALSPFIAVGRGMEM